MALLSFVLALQATLGRAVPVVLKKPIVVLKDNRDNKGQQCHAVCISESYQLIFCILLKITSDPPVREHRGIFLSE